MSFREIERVIGSKLPQSAREHRPWWANNEHSHVPKRGWLRAGFRTARVDMAGERLVFVRHGERSPLSGSAPQRATPAAADPTGSEPIVLSPQRLSPAARRLLAEEAALHDGDVPAAIASLLHGAAADRKRKVIAEFVGQSRPGRDSADLVREDRDAR